MATMTTIYVYRRPDGTIWADFKPGGSILETHNLNTPEKVIANPGIYFPERVVSLAKKKLEHRQPTLPDTESITIKKRNFIGRLKWLITGN